MLLSLRLCERKIHVASRSGDASWLSPASDTSSPGTAYAPLNQLPRSTSRQRAQQNGKDLCSAIEVYSNSRPQYGQRARLRGGSLGIASSSGERANRPAVRT